MKIYAITITPASPFGTPLKGDTVFGHFCWQAAEDAMLLNGGLETWLNSYADEPFAVFSSALPILKLDGEAVYVVSRPAGLKPEQHNSLSRKDKFDHDKKDKKRKWLLIDQSLQIQMDTTRLKSDADLFDLFLRETAPAEARELYLLPEERRKLFVSVAQSHNGINRQTMTTGGGNFAPFSHQNTHYLPGLSLIIFVAINSDAIWPEQLKTGFERIGVWGYGRDASSGLGRFTVDAVLEHPWPSANEQSTGCYTLAPSVPQKDTFRECHAEPFTRFGRFGSTLARSKKPFKAPVVMADEGAVLYPATPQIFTLPYLGTAVKNVSTLHSEAVVQGYTLYLPVEGEIYE